MKLHINAECIRNAYISQPPPYPHQSKTILYYQAGFECLVSCCGQLEYIARLYGHMNAPAEPGCSGYRFRFPGDVLQMYDGDCEWMLFFGYWPGAGLFQRFAGQNGSKESFRVFAPGTASL